jgi:hypothetical protein
MAVIKGNSTEKIGHIFELVFPIYKKCQEYISDGLVKQTMRLLA